MKRNLQIYNQLGHQIQIAHSSTMLQIILKWQTIGTNNLRIRSNISTGKSINYGRHLRIHTKILTKLRVITRYPSLYNLGFFSQVSWLKISVTSTKCRRSEYLIIHQNQLIGCWLTHPKIKIPKHGAWKELAVIYISFVNYAHDILYWECNIYGKTRTFKDFKQIWLSLERWKVTCMDTYFFLRSNQKK